MDFLRHVHRRLCSAKILSEASIQHPQPYLRKKAILCLFKVFVKYPQGLRLTFSQIQNCLNDQNSAVVSCAVNVITELSDKNPKNYLHLAPAFFDVIRRQPFLDIDTHRDQQRIVLQLFVGLDALAAINGAGCRQNAMPVRLHRLEGQKAISDG